ncbi:MAG: hypothetical protein M1825_005220 [Sarcosagium campestre]|nr:MAG: hypothetical protein M1825_005220 [Sarcosagium campestre]
MSGSWEKSVKGGTKIKLAPPKSKYVEHILIATHAGEAGVAEIFRTLQNRLRDSTWTIVFKSLIIVHLMIREGEPDVTLKYVAANSRKLAISNFSEVQSQGRNIRHYTQYLLERAKSYRETRVDFVRNGEGRLKRLTVEKGLLRETEAVQNQIVALLKCDLLSNEPENEITLTAFRLLVTDLLALFHVMNEGVINFLEHFFEMSKYDAERALAIYKTFSKQTNYVVEYLSIARQYAAATRVEVPKLKHAPTSLTGALEQYLHDPDFEINRRQYLAQQEAKKSSGKSASRPFATDGSKPAASRAATGKQFPSPKAQPAVPVKAEVKGPAPDLIDFFESIEQNQQPMAQSVPQQQQQQLQQQQHQQMPQFQQGPQFQAQQQQPPLQYQQTSFAPSQSVFGTQAPLQSDTSFNPAFNNNQNGSPFGQPQQVSAPTGFSGPGIGGFAGQAQAAFTPQQNNTGAVGQNNNIIPFDTNKYQHTPNSGPVTNGQAPQNTNPFRQSTMPQSTTGSSIPSFSNSSTLVSPLNRQSTNPFAKSISNQPTAVVGDQSALFAPNPSPPTAGAPQLQTSSPFGAQPLQTAATGTNPFARNASPFQSPAPQQQPVVTGLAPNQTGAATTNPFRQSMFQNPQTGAGWQQGQGTMGGLEQLPTVPVFPRPGEVQGGPGQPQQQQQQQQQQQGWP